MRVCVCLGTFSNIASLTLSLSLSLFLYLSIILSLSLSLSISTLPHLTTSLRLSRAKKGPFPVENANNIMRTRRFFPGNVVGSPEWGGIRLVVRDYIRAIKRDCESEILPSGPYSICVRNILISDRYYIFYYYYYYIYIFYYRISDGALKEPAFLLFHVYYIFFHPST